MATSFVEFGRYGFWTQDYVAQGLSHLLAREFDAHASSEPWRRDIIEKWRVAASAGFMGCVPCYLDDVFGRSEERLECLRQTLKVISNRLLAGEDYVTHAELAHILGFELKALATLDNHARLRHGAELMLALIDGELRTSSASPIDYWPG